MTTLAFQAKINLQSAIEQAPGVWEVGVIFTDNEAVFLATNVTVGDIFVFDTGSYDTGTLTRYVVSSITSIDSGTGSVVAVVEYESTNNNPAGAPDLNYCLGLDGIVTRKSPNHGLLAVTSPSVQLLPDKFSFYLTNYNMQEIVDNLGGGGGGTAVKPDWNALSTDPAGILNKPTLGTASTYDVPVSGDADFGQVVLGSDTRLTAAAPQVLTNTTPTPTTIGGIAAGTTFASIPVETVLQNLLYPYQTPAFTSFAMSGQTSPIEVGASVSGGARTFTWGTSNSSNINVNSISIIDVTNGNTTLASSLTNTGSISISISSVTKITATTHQWRIQAISTVTAPLSSIYTITWQWRRFYGESTNTTMIAADVQALRVGGLSASFAGTYPFNAGGYKWIAYPALLGTASSFKDQSTNLDVPFQPVQTLSITNTNGITTSYNVHRTVNIIGSAMNIVVA